MADRITLKSMQFHARVGVYPHEAEFAQPIEIDLSVEVDAFVDYTTLHAAAAEVMAAPHIQYLEDIAEQVAERVLQIDGVGLAQVSVRKPHVPLAGPLDYVEIALTRTRRA